MIRDELLERGDETVTIRQIVERFEAVEEEYNGVPWTLKQIYTQIDMLVSEKPCGDCISRQVVLEAIDAKAWEFCDYLIREGRNDEQKPVSHFADNLRECVGEDLPPVTPQPKMGSSSVNPNKWIPCSERLPEDLEPVNITWVNHNPVGYYADIKDKPFTATGHYCKGRWYWYSSTCQDYLKEYGRYDVDEIDTDIEVTAWMPLPEPYTAEGSEE